MIDIHDIRPPVQVGVNPLVYYGIGGGLLAVILVGLLIWWIRRRSHNSGIETVAATIDESPSAEAHRLLADLEKAGSLSPVVYYFRLSAVFRLYLKRRFAIPATEMTTEELLPALATKRIDAAMFSDIKRFFRFADEVKFARQPCDKTHMCEHMELVRRMIGATTPASAETDEEG
ncbi:MAG: transmembrane domain-containing protein [Thermodesulfobacteriota bacterium]|nr:transmembrane domain-containing protein [Thermodesulfobacteriota bacterium]